MDEEGWATRWFGELRLPLSAAWVVGEAGAASEAARAAASVEGVRAVIGKMKRLSRSQHRRILRSVEDAERATGLQFCVYLGPTGDDPRAHAEALFEKAGLHARPAVLFLVSPQAAYITGQIISINGGMV